MQLFFYGVVAPILTTLAPVGALGTVSMGDEVISAMLERPDSPILLKAVR
jgi:hypothetical protein